ncbi:hypothetical protein BV25DRAFT_1869513 [Artomyces pyxidatus]|uniref:Uncharacterized protein n=1 Tax=Artomyces pyxidatus TaxID=48021 RepID=A0ACB8T733_9AGAM|nr:hypothetical protein BV25DRAFT_1869513 [Artomyces pyxidatus]
MSNVPAATVHTALSIPIATSYPSINCLQWTEDGQLLLQTKTAIYILTPDFGVNFDPASTITAQPKNNEAAKPLGWFRTMIGIDRRAEAIYAWPADSQEWGAVALGSLDIALRSVTASPSSLSADAGCVLAVLNSNLELSLWCAVKNHLKGQWIQLQDATSFLTKLAASRTQSHVQRTLQAQVNCLSWSMQCDFGITPAPFYDGSLLALGSRAGTIALLRFRGKPENTDYLEHIQTITVANTWITHLAWAQWATSGLNESKSVLACGIADGSVTLVEITQTLHLEPGASSFGIKCLVETEACLAVSTPCSADKRGITGIKWIEPAAGKPILVCCKVGTVHLWTAYDATGGWCGTHSMTLQRQDISIDSSPLHPVSGLQYLAKDDILVLSLFDGTFRVIYSLSTSPTFLPPGGDMTFPSATDLSLLARSVFVQTEKEVVTRLDVNRISGLVSFDNASTVAWVHEGCRPSDFNYKHEAKHNSTLIVTDMWHAETDEGLLLMLRDTLSLTKAAPDTAPIHILRPLFTHLHNPGTLPRLHSEILLDLPPSNSDQGLVPSIPSWSGEITREVRMELRGSLGRHLFGDDSLLSSRLRLATADFCWKYAMTPQSRGECGAVAQGLLTAVSHRILCVLAGHLSAIEGVFTQNDLPFVYRVIVQSLLPGSPPSLAAAAEALDVLVTAKFPHTSGSDSASFNGLHEKCPACAQTVLLEDISTAVCPNGHSWSRCSITSFILATPMVRTCIGCARKAFLPPISAHSRLQARAGSPQNSNVEEARVEIGVSSETSAPDKEHLPDAARSWIVEELLEAVQRCLFCGNNFITVI